MTTDQQRADMGLYAQQARENPAVQQAIKQLHELAYAAFKKVPITDAEGLKIARQHASVVEDFETMFWHMVQGGRAAQMNIDRHRDESAARKAMRKFSR